MSPRWLPLLLLSGCWIDEAEHADRLSWWYQVSAGYQETCGLAADRTLRCWGEMDAPAPSGRFDQVSAGYLHACAIQKGRVRCWGQVGEDTGGGDDPAPSVLQGIPTKGSFTAVSTLATDACALDDVGRVQCWGRTESMRDNAPGGAFEQIAAGERFACGLRTGHQLTCWGDDDNGETLAPAGLYERVDVAAEHACAIREGDGGITCWGEATYDSLGGRFVDLAVGWRFVCGLTEAGEVRCIDQGGDTTLDAPRGSFVSIDAGEGYVCGITDDGRMLCWGEESSGAIDVPRNPAPANPGG